MVLPFSSGTLLQLDLPVCSASAYCWHVDTLRFYISLYTKTVELLRWMIFLPNGSICDAMKMEISCYQSEETINDTIVQLNLSCP